MNYYLLAIAVINLILTAIYVVSTQKTIKKLIIIGTYWRNEAIRLSSEHKTLQDQYRQLSRIFDAVKDINKTKNKNEQNKSK